MSNNGNGNGIRKAATQVVRVEVAPLSPGDPWVAEQILERQKLYTRPVREVEEERRQFEEYWYGTQSERRRALWEERLRRWARRLPWIGVDAIAVVGLIVTAIAASNPIRNPHLVILMDLGLAVAFGVVGATAPPAPSSSAVFDRLVRGRLRRYFPNRSIAAEDVRVVQNHTAGGALLSALLVGLAGVSIGATQVVQLLNFGEGGVLKSEAVVFLFAFPAVCLGGVGGFIDGVRSYEYLYRWWAARKKEAETLKCQP